MHTHVRKVFLLGIVCIVYYTFRTMSGSHYITSRTDGIQQETNAELVPPSSPTPLTEEPAPILPRRANATFVILARNSDLNGTIQSIQEIEERFNQNFNYPYVMLNDEEFSDEFKKRVSALTKSSMEFGVVPHEHWKQPDWIDEEKAAAGRAALKEIDIIYAESVSYRNMCRFNSGFFFKHPLMQKYRYYWRIEPDVHFHCDVDFDPFLLMQDEKKTYGFTIAVYEFKETVLSLWGHVKDFIKEHPESVAEENSARFLSDDDGDNYNLCHFWSNFEIADMEFWRGPTYTAFFDYLESKGGFYYERWGDAPVHSIAAALFLPKKELHFFDEIGYGHHPFTHCPQTDAKRTKGHCTCDPYQSFDYHGYSCMRKWDQLWY